MTTLYCGDNRDFRRRYLKDETVDLVYLDPPFNSAQNYNAFVHENEGPKAASVGFYEHRTNRPKYPRLQLRTVKELMEGQGIERPTSAAASVETFKRAPESKKRHGHQTEFNV
jgi:16S rRNA G966 N2-methylase RsmD